MRDAARVTRYKYLVNLCELGHAAVILSAAHMPCLPVAQFMPEACIGHVTNISEHLCGEIQQTSTHAARGALEP